MSAPIPVDHNHIGHNYVDDGYTGHSYTGRNLTGHTNTGHTYTVGQSVGQFYSIRIKELCGPVSKRRTNSHASAIEAELAFCAITSMP